MDYSKFPVFSDSIEQVALDQFYSACSLPFTTRAALMPDAHLGYSLPIGAVGDAINLFMAAAAFNFRKWMRKLGGIFALLAFLLGYAASRRRFAISAG